MKLSNFISNCRKPRVIENARGKKICVNCGSCPDCNNAKNLYNVKRLIDESMQNTYCYFLTLTYDYENVPTMMLKQIDIDGKKHISCIDVTNRFVSVDKARNFEYKNKRLSKRQLPTYHEEIHRIPTTFNDPLFKKFYKKAHERGSNIFKRKPFKFLPYLSKVDLQRFIKRLRFKVASELDAEIRYFAVGEYSPKHFLPHFHMLLFFDESRVGKFIEEYVNQCWQYGIVDCQPSLSSHGCSSYLASYTNSFTTLPSFLNGAKIRPFSVHSQNLGILYNNEVRDYVYSLDRYDFKPFDFSIAGNTFSFSYTPQIVHSFFPRCYNYERQSSYNIYKLYTCFRELSQRYDFNRVSDLASCVLVDYDSYYNRCILNALDIDDDVLDLSNLSSKIQVSEKLSLLEQTIYNRVYTCISTSRLFVRNLESPSLKSQIYNFRDFETKARFMIEMIRNFYNQKSIYNLNQQYTLQNEYYDTFGTDNYDIFYPVHDSLSVDSNNERYKKIYESSQYVHYYNFEKDIEYSKKVKHKQLNDLNKIFTNIY